MVKKLHVFIFLSLLVCAPCFAQSTVQPKRETVTSGGSARTTAPADSKVTQGSGLNVVEGNKDYTKRKILEFEGRLAALEKEAAQTATKLAQIQQTLTTIQSALDKQKAVKPQTEAKQPAESPKSETEKSGITVRRLDTGNN
jgi:hypothetical protein